MFSLPSHPQVNQHMLHNQEMARRDCLAAISKQEAVRSAKNIRRSKKAALNLVCMLQIELPITNLFQQICTSYIPYGTRGEIISYVYI